MRMWALAIHRRGWKVTVLTTTASHWKLKADPGLLEGLPADMEIIRTPSPDAWLAKFPHLGSALFRLLAKAGVPDIHGSWRFTAMHRIRPWMVKNKPDLVYSRQPKHVSAMVAMQLKKEFQVPWIAHFSDLWAALPYRDHYTSRQWRVIEALEGREVAAADALLFVSKRAADKTLSHYDAGVRAKATLIRHGYESLPARLRNSRRQGGGEMRMVHAGAFYPGISGPQGLFAAIAALHGERSLCGRFKLSCVGPETVGHQALVNRLGIADLVSLESIIPFADAQQRVAAADVMLVVPYDGTAMPTKLFEYFAFGKPILGLAMDDSDTADLMKDCGLPVVPPDDVVAITGQLRRLLDQWEQHRWGLTEQNAESIARYHIDHQVEIAGLVMDRLVRE